MGQKTINELISRKIAGCDQCAIVIKGDRIERNGALGLVRQKTGLLGSDLETQLCTREGTMGNLEESYPRQRLSVEEMSLILLSQVRWCLYQRG